MKISGKYGEAVIYTDLVDEKSIEQVKELLDQPFAEGQTIRMMPDIHAGAGCVIGTTMTITDKVCPNLVGVDIGCGMLAVKIDAKTVDFAKFDKAIRELIPNGMNIHNFPTVLADDYAERLELESLCCRSFCDLERAKRSLGTLGGGNHFIELDKESSGAIWLVIHSGSRHLGLEVANYYQKKAVKSLKSGKAETVKIISKLKAEHREKEIQAAIEKLKSKSWNIPDALCWCEGDLLGDYLNDMCLVQQFAMFNRWAIKKVLCIAMGWETEDYFSTINNYIDIKRMILRKGAVSAEAGQRMLIPMNMRDGSLICEGKGNPDWNYSAPHGAGRMMSRNEARAKLTMDEFQGAMAGIWSTSVNTATIDESPMAYKPMKSIVENLLETAEIVDVIKPIYNFKASEGAPK